MSNPLWLVLQVNPEPWAVGPLQAVRRGGKLSAFMGRNQQLASYQEAVREAVREQWGDLPTLDGLIRLDVYLWRQRSEYKTPAERKHRKHEADATNMLKALEDALQGVLFKNDRDNISVSSHIIQQDGTVQGKVVIRVQVVDPVQHRADLVNTFPDRVTAELARMLWEVTPPSAADSWGTGDDIF